MTQPSPGWYDAPDRPGQLRYWNGTSWTDQYAPRPPAPPSGAPVAPAAPSMSAPPAPAVASPSGAWSAPGAAVPASGAWQPAPARTLTQAVRVCLRNYGVFRGRAARSEFWWFHLALALAGMAFFLLLAVFAVGVAGTASSSGFDPAGAVAGGALFAILALVLFIGTIVPSLAVTVRRLHDTGRSGWWMWIAIGPYLGSIVFSVVPVLGALMALAYLGGSIALIVLLCLPGTPGPNAFDVPAANA